MSIVPLEHATFVGLTGDKEALLDDLHRFGSLEIIPLGSGTDSSAEVGPSSDAREALKFLLTSPQRRRQVSDHTLFNAVEVEQKALELQSRIQTLEAERDDLLQRIAVAKPFGKFEFSPLEQMGNLRLWFYAVPHNQMSDLKPVAETNGDEQQLAWEIAERDQRFCYVVVISHQEPQNMPVPRARIGSRSPTELARRLEEVELGIEDAQAERAFLTRWCLLFAKSLTELEDAAARANAAQQTYDSDRLFALEAWVPQEHVEELAQYSQTKGYLFESRPPSPEENPPTLMRNTPNMEAGEDLVNFYMTPGYSTWDPSSIVCVSFAIFFAMILADAGYAAVLGLGLLFFWRKLGKPTAADDITAHGVDEEGNPADQQPSAGQRFRPMMLMIVVFSLVYGVLVGSYFGISPPPDSLFGRLHVLDINNSPLMMGVSILVGGLHLVLANLMNARRFADWRDGLAAIGWAAAVGGGLLYAAGSLIPAVTFLKSIGIGMALVGLIAVVGFTAWHERPLKRLGHGLFALTRISGAFGDILSYLRLFALGLASASLATAFNDMAAGIYGGLPRLGLLFALLVLTFGHALNLLLGVSSGVIHGLRLNVIEFFNWGLSDEGRRFTPFRRKGGSLWK
ncbi:V-type ATP synthase subunit I [Symmachiella dynata]|uniref:V-type ATP synthase subunit I n=1 Tax=Symmachiella dynata TaxID=2527995 RepID=A0A517ZY12_9PLAN|nr:ATPase V [Symmachiella dynata]QDU47357.1 V-type ATP synthase subunit I [Symmachiella dynata]